MCLIDKPGLIDMATSDLGVRLDRGQSKFINVNDLNVAAIIAEL